MMKQCGLMFFCIVFCLFIGCSSVDERVKLEGKAIEPEDSATNDVEKSSEYDLKEGVNSIVDSDDCLLSSSNDGEVQANLDTWVGEYEYIELEEIPNAEVPSRSTVAYSLTIYRDDAGYKASFYIYGWLSGLAVNAYVEGDDQCVSIIFDSYLPNGQGIGAWGEFQKGDVLFSLYRTDLELYTQWEKVNIYYAHLNRSEVPFVEVEDVLQKGTILGIAGTSGNSPGSHTHIEFKGLDGKTVSPQELIERGLL